MAGVAEQADLLASPDRRRGEVLVDARLEADLVHLEEPLRLAHREIDPTQRRAAIAGDEAGGIEARRIVALALTHRQANPRLGHGQENPTGFEAVLLVQRYGHKRHGTA